MGAKAVKDLKLRHQDLRGTLLGNECSFFHVRVFELLQMDKRLFDGLRASPLEQVVRAAGLIVSA